MRCVGTFYASVGEKTAMKCPFGLHSHAYITPCSFRVPQRKESGLIILSRILDAAQPFNLSCASCVSVQGVRFQDFLPSMSLPKDYRLYSLRAT